MKTNKKFLTILTLCIALLLTACGATDAAGTDKTKESLTETGTVSADSSNTSLDDLYQQENQIFADHEAVWNKVFGMMSKSNADPSGNYTAGWLRGPFLLSEKIFGFPLDRNAKMCIIVLAA